MDTDETRRKQLNDRLDGIGWALFLIMIGGLSLVPQEQLPGGVWMIGVGVIMLGINVVRLINRVPLSSFTLILGSAVLIIGVGSLLGLDLPLLPILLIVLGLNALYKTFTGARVVD